MYKGFGVLVYNFFQTNFSALGTKTREQSIIAIANIIIIYKYFALYYEVRTYYFHTFFIVEEHLSKAIYNLAATYSL